MSRYNLEELEEKILNDILEDPRVGRLTVSRKYGISTTLSRKLVKKVKELIYSRNFDYDDSSDEILEESAKLYKQKQRLQDQQRIERKIRNKIRTENAINEYSEEILKVLQNRGNSYKIYPIQENAKEEYKGILQLSDLHLNELIDINNNKFDFNIAASRLKKYVDKARSLFKQYGVKNILIAMTGDLLNSDRRLDELLNMSTNRAKATVLSVNILEQMILELSEDFNISITSVTGNESRAGEFMGSSEIMVSDSYDMTIYEMLKMLFKNQPINFIDGPFGEKVISINDKNVLLLHGHQINKNVCKQIQQIKGKYSDKGIRIDYVIFGHIHECLIADGYARSSSLCGANAYSDYTLQLTSRASQNIHLVSSSSIDSIKIDLQEYDGYQGYNVDSELEAYNAKSLTKGKDERYVVVNVL